jgi:DNA-binding winged helix-turn-helix (wHTH) protein
VIYAFDDCELDLRRFELRRNGRTRRIEPQVFDVLVLLVRERDRVVTKEEILDSVWGDRFVSESALTSRIKALRQALGDDGTRPWPARPGRPPHRVGRRQAVSTSMLTGTWLVMMS